MVSRPPRKGKQSSSRQIAGSVIASYLVPVETFAKSKAIPLVVIGTAADEYILMLASGEVYVLSDQRNLAFTALAGKDVWSGIKVTTSLALGTRSFSALGDVTGTVNGRTQSRVNPSHWNEITGDFETSSVSHRAVDRLGRI